MRLLLAAFLITISPVAFSETWRCEPSSSFILDDSGQAIPLPLESHKTLIVKFIPPNRMKVLKAASPMDFPFYQNITWTKIGDTIYGQGIHPVDNFIVNLSGTFSDQEHVFTIIPIGAAKFKAGMGMSKCQKIE